MRVYRRRLSVAQMIQARARLMAQKAEYEVGSVEESNCQAMIDRYTQMIGE